MGAETVAIIPARYRSTRLPGKALASIGDRPMICHVLERTQRARGLAGVIVATDDARIRDAIVAIGGRVIMTRADHPSGTDRLAEVLTTVRDEEGVALLLVEHDLELVLSLSARVQVLDFGRCVAVGTPDEIRADPAVRAAYIGSVA